MSCERSRELLDAYFDEELDLVRSLEIDAHLKGCINCRAVYEEYQFLRYSLQQGGAYFEPSEALGRKIRAQLSSVSASQGKKGRLFRTIGGWRVLAVSGSIAALVIVTAIFAGMLRGPSSTGILAQQVVSSHIRSLIPNHLTDVISADQHTVKPWFNGRLDFAPVVKDLAFDGFPLTGGRLDYLDGRLVAALIYKRHQHTINLFEWPASHSDSRLILSSMNGYNIVHWNHSGMTYWAISDLNARELTNFAQACR